MKTQPHTTTWPALLALLICVMGCGGNAESDSTIESRGSAEREGPEGCYIIAQMSCDCDLAQEDCTEEIGGTWTSGCLSCEVGSTGREGPEGCYLPTEMTCDCDIGEGACAEGAGTWTEGCSSCAE